MQAYDRDRIGLLREERNKVDVIHLALILDPAHEIREGIDVFLTSAPTEAELVAIIWRIGFASLKLLNASIRPQSRSRRYSLRIPWSPIYVPVKLVQPMVFGIDHPGRGDAIPAILRAFIRWSCHSTMLEKGLESISFFLRHRNSEWLDGLSRRRQRPESACHYGRFVLKGMLLALRGCSGGLSLTER